MFWSGSKLKQRKENPQNKHQVGGVLVWNRLCLVMGDLRRYAAIWPWLSSLSGNLGTHSNRNLCKHSRHQGQGHGEPERRSVWRSVRNAGAQFAGSWIGREGQDWRQGYGGALTVGESRISFPSFCFVFLLIQFSFCMWQARRCVDHSILWSELLIHPRQWMILLTAGVLWY